jgi:hypothetical protein
VCRDRDEPERRLTASDRRPACQGVGEGKLGGGGCIAYSLYRLGVFHSTGRAEQALDLAGEAIFQRRAREHIPSPRVGLCYPKAKVYTAGVTWCPEAVQHAVQAQQHRLHKVYPASEGGLPTADLQTLAESTAQSALVLLLEGTLAQTYSRSVRGGLEQITVDPHDPSPHDRPDLWRHSVAIRGGKLFDLFNPRGLGVESLRLHGNTAGSGGYMLKVLKAWSVKPAQTHGKRKRLA